MQQRDMRQRGHIALAALVWAIFSINTTRLFGPGSRYVGFSSDSAIPVLMSQYHRHTPFSLYYWGQDRFGAWPFLAASGWSGITGWEWTVERLSAAAICCALLGAMAFIAFSRREGWIAALSCVAVLLLQPSVRQTMFDLGQPYAWQLTMVVASWLLLRRLLNPNIEARWVSVLSFVVITLASWISPVTGPLILSLLLLELLRQAWNAGQGWIRPAFGRVGLALMIWALAVATEWLILRGLYHRYAEAHFGWDHRTLIRGDAPHLRENLAHLMPPLLDGGSSLIFALSASAVACLIFALVKSQTRASNPRQLASTEAWFLASGATLVALSNLAICALVSHVRKSAYDERYLCLTHVFLGIAAALALYGLAVRILRFRNALAIVTLAFSLSLLALLYAKLPERSSDPDFPSLKKLAQMVARDDRKRVLLGEYWSVYRLAALAPAGALIPLEADFDEDPRMPFNRFALQPGIEVIVIHGDPRLGSPEAPAQELRQYGVQLRLIDNRPWASAGITLSRYRAVAQGNLIR